MYCENRKRGRASRIGEKAHFSRTPRHDMEWYVVVEGFNCHLFIMATIVLLWKKMKKGQKKGRLILLFKFTQKGLFLCGLVFVSVCTQTVYTKSKEEGKQLWLCKALRGWYFYFRLHQNTIWCSFEVQKAVTRTHAHKWLLNFLINFSKWNSECHSVEIWEFSYHSDFTWNQILVILESPNLQFWQF